MDGCNKEISKSKTIAVVVILFLCVLQTRPSSAQCIAVKNKNTLPGTQNTNHSPLSQNITLLTNNIKEISYHIFIHLNMSSNNSTPANTTKQTPNNLTKKEQRQLKEQLKAKARLRQRAPKYIIMMGLPASGKSTFSNRLATEWQEQMEQGNQHSHHRNNKNNKWNDIFIIANQDKLGKKECISLVSTSSKKNRIILDRCNPSASDRKEWVDILHNPPKRDIALLYFAGSAESCIERAQNRVGHETIPEGRGERIINDMARRFEPPTDDERNNIFGTVITVESFDQCDDILRMWGC